MARENGSDVNFIVIICFVIMALASIFQIAALASNHWVDTVTDEYGTVGYSGLWEKCTNFEKNKDSCSGFQWMDVQVSHWFRTVQSMEVLGFIFGLVALLMMLLFKFLLTSQENSQLKSISVVLLILAFLLVIIGGIVFGSLKNVQKAYDISSWASFSWGFGVSITAALLYLASSIAVCIS